jgi:hypothetical protein
MVKGGGEKIEKESTRRPVMAGDSLRLELEPSPNPTDVVDDDYDDDGRAGADYTMDSSGGGNGRYDHDESYDDDNDEEFFDEIANYFPAASDKALSTTKNAPMYHDDDVVQKSGTSQHDTKLLVSFILMVIVGTGNKIFQKLQAIPMYNYPNSMNLIQK